MTVSPHCLREELLRRYLAGGLAADVRGAAEEHLADCPDCCRRLASLHHANRSEPARGLETAHRVPEDLKRRVRDLPRRAAERRRVRWLAAAAAVVVASWGALLWTRTASGPPPANGDPRGEPLRGEPLRGDPLRGDGGTSGPIALVPEDGTAVAAGTPILFGWTPVHEAARYTLVVVDAKGDVVARGRAEHDRLTLSDPLSVPGTYYWYVTAELGDGTHLESEVAGFVVVEPAGSE